MQEHLVAEIQQEKEREDQQLLGIAYHKKSEECAFCDLSVDNLRPEMSIV